MKNKIIICGGNGAGKSTLGRSLARKLGYQFPDIENYYFKGNCPDYGYEEARIKEERSFGRFGSRIDNLSVPVIHVNGTKPAAYNVEFLMQLLEGASV